VCLTNWHADQFKNLYPTLSKKIHIINNGIVPELFAIAGEKIKNRFIYSSCSERGLERLIELWPNILERKLDATLVVVGYNKFPSTILDQKIATEILKYKDSVTHLGQLNSTQMYEQMRIAEYWLYPTNWCETSCITALEMLASGIICLYYPLAGLVDTVGTYGIQISQGNEVDALCSLTNERKNEMRIKDKEYALSCSWKNRADTWCNVLGLIELDVPIKIINLERRSDRKENMIREFEKQGITLREENFVKAVDGKELKLTEELYELFKGNNFNYRQGVIGCALSHYYLWKQLVNDETFDYYVIMEDDINLCDDFKKYFGQFVVKNKIVNDLMFLGYSMYSRNKQQQLTCDHTLIDFRKNLYVGGFFCYTITKTCANKLVSHILHNGIKQAIDCIVNSTDLNCIEVVPHLAHTEWNENGKTIDTDIQNNYECIEADEQLFNNHYVFIPNNDQNGCDITHQPNLSLNKIAVQCLANKNAVGFNTYKWIKHSLIVLSEPSWFTGNQGIYIKKQAYLDYCKKTIITDKDVELVVSQCNVSREKAQETLLKNNGDIVQSIIELTSCI
jgi:GR25 family glycosyltransferase involved in LPS biosynthesis